MSNPEELRKNFIELAKSNEYKFSLIEELGDKVKILPEEGLKREISLLKLMEFSDYLLESLISKVDEEVNRDTFSYSVPGKVKYLSSWKNRLLLFIKRLNP